PIYSMLAAMWGRGIARLPFISKPEEQGSFWPRLCKNVFTNDSCSENTQISRFLAIFRRVSWENFRRFHVAA
ncbi:hypothetical protein, partial [Pseudomonas aeruginosa]|uniref:hypothetical protein n=1 Tax=Pseudomonas aeruginosa TaxID=287 RepID=UPI001C6940EB